MCNSVNFIPNDLSTTTKNQIRPTNTYLLCPFGQVETLLEFGIAYDEFEVCPTDPKMDYVFTDTECDFKGMGED